MALTMVVVACLLTAAEAPPPAPEPAPQEWYGWQVLALDGGMIATTVGLTLTLGQGQSSSNSVPLWLLLCAGYQLATPLLIHFGAHQNHHAGFADLNVRLLALVVGALVGGGAALATFPSQNSNLLGLLGFLVPIAGAIAYDAITLSWGPAKTPGARQAGFQLVPVGGVVGGTPFAGVAGTF